MDLEVVEDFEGFECVNCVLNHLGKISHQDADELMRIMQAKRIEDEIIDPLLICERDEVVTVGPRARNDGILPPKVMKPAL